MWRSPSGPSSVGPPSSGCLWPCAGSWPERRATAGSTHPIRATATGSPSTRRRAPVGLGSVTGPESLPDRPGAKRSVLGGAVLESLPFGPAPSAGHIGAVIDHRSRTATAVLAIQGHSFALLGPADQDARIAAWARVLSALAREGSDVHRIQWIESCLPDDGGSVRNHWSAHAALGADSPAGCSYQALVDESAPATRRHRVLLALSIHTSRSSRSIRSAGRGWAGIGAVLHREVLALHRALDGADISVDGVLGPRALARVIGESYAPSGGGAGAGRSSGLPGARRVRTSTTA